MAHLHHQTSPSYCSIIPCESTQTLCLVSSGLTCSHGRSFPATPFSYSITAFLSLGATNTSCTTPRRTANVEQLFTAERGRGQREAGLVRTSVRAHLSCAAEEQDFSFLLQKEKTPHGCVSAKVVIKWELMAVPVWMTSKAVLPVVGGCQQGKEAAITGSTT